MNAGAVNEGAVVLIDGARSLDGRISVFDRGFLFGDAVFEVLRTYGGVPFALEEHLERLQRSIELLSIAADLGPLPGEIDEAVRAVRTSIATDCYVRIVVTRGVGPLHLDPAPARSPSRVVIAAPLLPLPPALEQGVAMATVRAHRAADATPASAAKVTAYVGNLLAYVEARRRSAYEALLTTEGGEILEGHSSSFFVVRQGRVETPPLSMGILPGITRARVQRACAGLGMAFVERVLVPSEVYRADEAFLCSSLREVVPVTSIDGLAIGDGALGPVTARVREAYRAALPR